MLKDVIVEERRNIGIEATQKLSLSMKTCLRKIIAAKGYHTRY